MEDGMSFDIDSSSIHFDNYWTNQLIPASLKFSKNGIFSLRLPQDTCFEKDGSFTISCFQVDFL